jgi:hypothetical protein
MNFQPLKLVVISLRITVRVTKYNVNPGPCFRISSLISNDFATGKPFSIAEDPWNIYVLQTFQTGHEAHPLSYLTDSFLAGKEPMKLSSPFTSVILTM